MEDGIGFMKFFVAVTFFHISESLWTLTGSSSVGIVGEPFTLTCTPDQPNSGAIRWGRDSLLFAAISVTANGSCIVGSDADPRYLYTCESGPVLYLKIPSSSLTFDLHNTLWRCEDPLFGTQVEYTLSVKAPVTNVTIQGDPGYPGLDVIYENQPKTFICTTNPCLPKANVTVITTDVNKVQLTETTEIQGQLIISKASQTITATSGRHGKSIGCSAINIEGRHSVLSQNVTLIVYFAPNVDTSLKGYTTGTVLYEGEGSLTLNCQQFGGNPLSLITWACDGKTGYDNSTNSVSSSNVQLTIHRNLNGKTCTCNVKHPDRNVGYKKIKSVTFTVHYIDLLPTKNKLIYDSTEDIVLECIASGMPNIFTFHEWTHSISSKVIRKLKAETAFNVTSISIPYSSYNDFGTYTCYADNSNGITIRNAIQEVQIHDLPVITNNMKAIEVNGSGDIYIDFYSVPKPLKVEWYKNSKLIFRSEKFLQNSYVIDINLTLYGVKVNVSGYRATLVIMSPSEEDYGLYTLSIENEKGKAQHEINFYQKAPGAREDISALALGISLPVLLVVSAIIVVAFLWHRRKRRNEKRTTNQRNLKTDPNKLEDVNKYQDLTRGPEINTYEGIHLSEYETVGGSRRDQPDELRTDNTITTTEAIISKDNTNREGAIDNVENSNIS